jgi:hypothetical protein
MIIVTTRIWESNINIRKKIKKTLDLSRLKSLYCGMKNNNKGDDIKKLI